VPELRDIPVPDQHRRVPVDADAGVVNVARLYEQLAADIRGGQRTTPDFQTALRLHRLLDSIRPSRDEHLRPAGVS
jgi:hypothetical protein